MAESIFTKIINDEVPSYKVYEDTKTYVFLDIHPIQPGQVLIVPKSQVEFVWDLSDGDYLALMNTAKRIAKQLRAAFPEKSRVAMHIEGLDVAHAHLKVFPFSTDEEFRYHPDMSAGPDHATLQSVLEKIKSKDNIWDQG